MRRIARMLIKLTPESAAQVQESVRAAELPMHRPFVSVHLRRGDKVREYHGDLRRVTLQHTVRALKLRLGSQRIDWAFVMTDDVAAVEELRAAAPEWDVRSFAAEEDRGFNECRLPRVKALRSGRCGKQCTNLTLAAASRFRSYCFINPSAPDDQLVSVRSLPPLDEREAGLKMLRDLWVAIRAERHMAVGCGSNVDKLVQVLRDRPLDTAECILRVHGSAMTLCRPNSTAFGLAGINCSSIS